MPPRPAFWLGLNWGAVGGGKPEWAEYGWLNPPRPRPPWNPPRPAPGP